VDKKSNQTTLLAAEFIFVNFKVSEIFRQIHDIKGAWGTAVTVQVIVSGNMDLKSSLGNAFTRNPC
jgi:hypothetical protein